MFEKIPYGSYTVVESKPLPGYLPSGAQVTLTLDGTFVNPTEPIAVIPNERMKLTFKKVDTAETRWQALRSLSSTRRAERSPPTPSATKRASLKSSASQSAIGFSARMKRRKAST